MEHMGIDVDNVPIKSGRAESCQIGAKFWRLNTIVS